MFGRNIENSKVKWGMSHFLRVEKKFNLTYMSINGMFLEILIKKNVSRRNTSKTQTTSVVDMLAIISDIEFENAEIYRRNVLKKYK